jgi:hypothetical protein
MCNQYLFVSSNILFYFDKIIIFKNNLFIYLDVIRQVIGMDLCVVKKKKHYHFIL